MNRPTPAQVASIVGDNLVPVAGVLFLGWKAAWLVLLYFCGFLLDIAACAVLLWMLEPDAPKLDATRTTAGRVKGFLGLLLGLAVFVGLFAAVFGMPVMAVLYSDPGMTIKGTLLDPGFSMALAIHLLMAAHGFVQVHRGLRAQIGRDPGFRPSGPVRRRFAFITARWVVVLAASFFLAIPAVLVIAYCAASIWFELRPLEAEPKRQ